MAAVKILAKKILSCEPPSPIQCPPIIYVEGYGEDPTAVRDPRLEVYEDAGLQTVETGPPPQEFMMRDSPAVHEEPAEDPSGLPAVHEEPAEDPADLPAVHEEPAEDPADQSAVHEESAEDPAGLPAVHETAPEDPEAAKGDKADDDDDDIEIIEEVAAEAPAQAEAHVSHRRYRFFYIRVYAKCNNLYRKGRLRRE